jgi:hypothetical protein
MKKTAFIIALLVLSLATLTNTSFADGVKTKKETKKVALKEHVCTSKCTNEKCALVHGEKGHKCTKDCKKNN